MWSFQQRATQATRRCQQDLESIKTFLRWCVGRAVLDRSPAEGVPLPAKEVARDRVLDERELAQVILADAWGAHIERIFSEQRRHTLKNVA
jgi:site-specific recombinase XerC